VKFFCEVLDMTYTPLASPVRRNLLALVLQNGGRAATRDLWPALGFGSPSAMSLHVLKLEHAGLIEVTRSHDPANRAITYVHVTDAGRRAYNEMTEPAAMTAA
jgi:DNA-binding MarR family transcriptional regulator